MELRLVRVWHQAIACIFRFPSVLIPYNAIGIDSMLAVGEIPCRNELRISYNAPH
jgi:hypothetical protein